ncbi:MAG: IS5 family transposase [Clostridiales bacterium]|nr:IS5 family transposase [Clostridiales bacterium]
MYTHNEKQMLLPHEFFLPFSGSLNPQNRWCKLATIIPWAEVEEKYIKNFKSLIRGNNAMSVRMALGSLIIQNMVNLSDRKLVEMISENPYMQYFIGLSAFIEEYPFDPSLLVRFRRRIGKKTINEINEMIAKPTIEKDDDEDKGTGDNTEIKSKEHSNSGNLLLDATCVPADIKYPTDINLLNTARESTEEIIDILHEANKGNQKKPRTYRNTARKEYMNIARKRRVSAKELRKGLKKQLGYIRRNLSTIDEMATQNLFYVLGDQQYRRLLVVAEVYRQQLEMYTNKTRRVSDRIVSLHMPFIRPIVRGKANAAVEFGAKLAISVVDGYTYMEEMSFDAYNEGGTLIASVERYQKKFRVYPQAVIADKIYRNRKNIRYCKERGIRLSGPPLGRPSKNKELLRRQYTEEKEDMGIRNAVEGKFGEGKRNYGLGMIHTKLSETSETVIAMQILVMNLSKRLRVLLRLISSGLFKGKRPPEYVFCT